MNRPPVDCPVAARGKAAAGLLLNPPAASRGLERCGPSRALRGAGGGHGPRAHPAADAPDSGPLAGGGRCRGNLGGQAHALQRGAVVGGGAGGGGAPARPSAAACPGTTRASLALGGARRNSASDAAMPLPTGSPARAQGLGRSRATARAGRGPARARRSGCMKWACRRSSAPPAWTRRAGRLRRDAAPCLPARLGGAVRAQGHVARQGRAEPGPAGARCGAFWRGRCEAPHGSRPA